jgi:hypothetical protein
LLYSVIQQAEYQSGAFESASQHINPLLGADAPTQKILGNLVETLNDCGRLLDDQRYFQKSDSFVSNIYLYHQVDPDVQKLRERIASYNFKVILTMKNQKPDRASI